MQPDDVVVEVVVDDGAAHGRGRTTVLRLSWRRSDPLAVALRLTSRPDHPALPCGRWLVLRDFLRYGLEETTGDGDVRIGPDRRRGRVRLGLTRAGCGTCVSLPSRTLREFLDETERIVPAGEERSEEALDALIELLLRT